MYRSHITEKELNLLVRYAKKADSKFVLEIGTLNGGTTKALAERLPEKSIITIDNYSWQQKSPLNVYDNLSEFDNVLILIGDSAKTSKFFTGRGFGLVFIDASHKYGDVKDDYNLWNRNCEVEYFAFHDAQNIGREYLALNGKTQIRAQKGVVRFVSELKKEQIDGVDTTLILRGGIR